MRLKTGVMLAAVAAALAVSGCKINPKEPEYYPKIAGNTFELQNRLDVVLPEVERINISYAFIQMDEDPQDIESPGHFSGPLWWYEERSAETPAQFIGIHLLVRDPAFEEKGGQIVKLSRTNYNAFDYCIDTSNPETVPVVLKPYLESLADSGAEVSTDLFIRRYVMRNERDGNERTDVVYIRDVVRLGYTCSEIGDVIDPAPKSQDIVNTLRSGSTAAFEVMS